MSAESPWMTAKEAAVYLKRGRRFVLSEIKGGRLRGAVLRSGQVLTRREWCDAWVADQATPIVLPHRRTGPGVG